MTINTYTFHKHALLYTDKNAKRRELSKATHKTAPISLSQ
jgi:hypothetical protein